MDVGYLFTAAPAKCSHCTLPWRRGISSWPPLLTLNDRVPDELWTEVRDIVQERGIKTSPMEKKCKKAKWLSGEALQITVKRRKQKAKEKRKDKSI